MDIWNSFLKLIGGDEALQLFFLISNENLQKILREKYKIVDTNDIEIISGGIQQLKFQDQQTKLKVEQEARLQEARLLEKKIEFAKLKKGNN